MNDTQGDGRAVAFRCDHRKPTHNPDILVGAYMISASDPSKCRTSEKQLHFPQGACKPFACVFHVLPFTQIGPVKSKTPGEPAKHFFGWFKVHTEYLERIAAEQKQAFKIEIPKDERYAKMVIAGINPHSGLEHVTIRTEKTLPPTVTAVAPPTPPAETAVTPKENSPAESDTWGDWNESGHASQDTK